MKTTIRLLASIVKQVTRCNMSQNKPPLYSVIPKEQFDALIPNAGYRKGTTQLVIDYIQHTVALKIGDAYYAQQFGNLEQASGKYKELKITIRNGEG
jgi:hypothetical protein